MRRGERSGPGRGRAAFGRPGSRVGLACLVVVATACGGPADDGRGFEVWSRERCRMCHGDRGGGTDLAPPVPGSLAGITSEAMERYLIEGTRPADRPGSGSWSVRMPLYDRLSASDRAALVGWLLAPGRARGGGGGESEAGAGGPTGAGP